MNRALRLESGIRKWLTLLSAFCLAVVLTLGIPAAVSADDPWPAALCEEGELGEQMTLICLPPGLPTDPLAGWNGRLVVYAHGYVPPQAGLALPAEELGRVHLAGGATAVEFFLSQGYAFVTTSYSKNGYAVGAAEKDLNELVRHFKTKVLPNAGMLQKVIIVGASEGGLITTLMVEKYPGVYDGGMALCGPISGMPRQAQYLADTRAVFDVFFPDVFDYGVADVPPAAWMSWGDLLTTIPPLLLASPATLQFLSVTDLPHMGDPATIVASTMQVLYYSVWGTPDMIETAGGMPYDNTGTWYEGSLNDDALNAAVERIDGSGRALAYVRRAYEPTGELERPLVTLHNLLDPGVPYWHETEYAARATPGMYMTIPPEELAVPYGHCEFTEGELQTALWMLQTAVGP
jgi:pimeloyl-ACP methyl ester carboxylesterase